MQYRLALSPRLYTRYNINKVFTKYLTQYSLPDRERFHVNSVVIIFYTPQLLQSLTFSPMFVSFNGPAELFTNDVVRVAEPETIIKRVSTDSRMSQPRLSYLYREIGYLSFIASSR